MKRFSLVMQIPLELDDAIDPVVLAHAVRAFEDQVTGTLLTQGARVGVPRSALLPPTEPDHE